MHSDNYIFGITVMINSFAVICIQQVQLSCFAVHRLLLMIYRCRCGMKLVQQTVFVIIMCYIIQLSLVPLLHSTLSLHKHFMEHLGGHKLQKLLASV